MDRRSDLIDCMADAIRGCQSGYYSYIDPYEAAVAAYEVLVEEGALEAPPNGRSDG